MDGERALSDTAGIPGLRRLVGYSLVTGLTNLIPLPLVDDWARDLLRQRQAMELARSRGVTLSGAETKILACGYQPPSVRGCLRGCLVTSVVKPAELLFKVVFKKIVRKVLFFLTVKDVIDTFSRTLHEGYLLRHGLEVGVLSAAGEVAPGPPRPQVLALRRAIEATCDEVDPRPLEKTVAASLRGSRRLLRRAGRAMSRRLRAMRRAARQPDEQAVFERLERQGEEELGGLIDEMTADLEGQASYLEALGKRLELRLAAAPPPPAAPTAAATP